MFFEVSDFVHFIFFVVLVGLICGEEDCFEFPACEEDCGGGVKDGQLLCTGCFVEVEADVGEGEDLYA